MSLGKEDGFTLTEVLVSLIIISLSMAAIWQGAGMVTQLNKRVSTQQHGLTTMDAFTDKMARSLIPLQPIEGADLRGDATRMVFGCQRDDDAYGCALAAPEGKFFYISDGKTYTTWPPEVDVAGNRPARLSAVLLRSSQGKSLAVLKLPVEHVGDCQFDMISRTCRDDAAVSEGAP